MSLFVLSLRILEVILIIAFWQDCSGVTRRVEGVGDLGDAVRGTIGCFRRYSSA
jgi:hypothetical protein